MKHAIPVSIKAFQELEPPVCVSRSHDKIEWWNLKSSESQTLLFCRDFLCLQMPGSEPLPPAFDLLEAKGGKDRKSFGSLLYKESQRKTPQKAFGNRATTPENHKIQLKSVLEGLFPMFSCQRFRPLFCALFHMPPPPLEGKALSLSLSLFVAREWPQYHLNFMVANLIPQELSCVTLLPHQFRPKSLQCNYVSLPNCGSVVEMDLALILRCLSQAAATASMMLLRKGKSITSEHKKKFPQHTCFDIKSGPILN